MFAGSTSPCLTTKQQAAKVGCIRSDAHPVTARAPQCRHDHLPRGSALSASDELISLTYEDPPLPGFNPSLRELQGERPVIGVRTPAGDEAWLVTRHAEIRQLLLDRRLGRTHPDPGRAPRYLKNPMLDQMRLGPDFASEPEAHAALRALLAPYFSGRSIGALQPQVARKVDEAVARLGTQAPPVDIHSQFSLPLTAQVLGELLGVPGEDCATFPALVCQLSDVVDTQHAEGGRDALFGYLRGLVARKRAGPCDDVLSGLVAAGNFDEREFPAPDEVDITRSPNPHLSFSHGMWHCTGAPLARMQLTMTFTALLAALPTLRLAKPLQDMARTPGHLGGLAELLVTW